MKLVEFSVKNSLFVNLLSLFIFLGGIVMMLRLPREVYPDVKYDIVMVTTILPGAPTEDVEKLVTIPIEEELRGVSGVKSIDSGSTEGISTISVTIDPRVSDKSQVVDDIRSAADRVRNLPDGAEDPEVIEVETRIIPVLDIYLGGNLDEETLRTYAEQLEDRLLDEDSVARIGRVGWRDREFWVELDPDKMREMHVSFDEVSAALRSRNVTVPGGILRNADQEYTIRTTGEFETAEEVMQVVVRGNDAGNMIRIQDVGQVRLTFEDRKTLSRLNGRFAMGLTVYKKEKRDVIRAVKAIKKSIEDFKGVLRHDVEIEIVDDMSFYVKRRLGVLSGNAISGFILVVIALFIFLDPVPAIFTALGIPMAMFMTFIVMSFLGMSVNVVSMIGLIIVLGMLVDDGIVVSDNVYRYVNMGMNVREAVVKGTSEVAMGIVASVVTTWASFTPLLMMTDIVGKFVWSIPVVVIIALAASMMEAFIVLPSHLADFMRPVAGVKAERVWLQWLQEWYASIILWMIARRFWVMGGVLGLIVVTVVLSGKFIKVIFFASDGVEKFQVMAEAHRGISVEKLSGMLRPVEDLLVAQSRGDIEAVTTMVGVSEGARGRFMSNTGSHLAQINVFMTPFQKRKLSAQEIIAHLRPEIEKIRLAEPAFEKLFVELPQAGPPTGKPVQVGVRGDKFEIINKLTTSIKAKLATLEGVSDIVDDYDYGKKQIEVVVDETKAYQASLTVGQIASSVRAAFYGSIATTIKPSRAEKEIDVLVRFPESVRSDLAAFDRILVQNSHGDLVRLGSVAKIEKREGLNSAQHYDGKRVVYVSAQVDDDKATSIQVNRILQQAFANVGKEYPGYSVYFGGQHQENMESLLSLGMAALFAFFLIFIILTAVFGSVVQALTIMMSIPFAFIGVVLAFMAHGLPLSFFAFVGMIGLAGVVVNNSILLIEFINIQRRMGLSRIESLVEAGRLRLRPILMTTVTTVLGLISIAYNFGGGDPFIRPMAMALVWGLVSSMFLTLLITPCLYALMDDFSLKFLHHSSVDTRS